ncbi:hypothetical protein ABTA35_20015, partial [Acinetobacter baumannii]
CIGTVKLPNPQDLEVQEKCDRMLFDSWSTHPNFDDTKQSLHPAGLIALMDELVAEKANAFPIKTLAPINITLGKYLAQDSKR